MNKSFPGIIIKKWMEENNISKTNLSRRLGLKLDIIEKLLEGNYNIDEGLAISLGITIGPNAEFWMKTESLYRQDFVRGIKDTELSFDITPAFIKEKLYLEYNAAIFLEEFSKKNKIALNVVIYNIIKEFLKEKDQERIVNWKKDRQKNRIKDIEFCIDKNIWDNAIELLQVTYEREKAFYYLNNIIESIILEKLVK